MIKKYRISEKAISDIERVWLYTNKNWSKEQADRYYNLIIDEIIFVVNNFELCKKVDFIRPGYRISKVKSHYIFFKKAADNYIEIIRVLHQSMDIENRLMEDDE